MTGGLETNPGHHKITFFLCGRRTGMKLNVICSSNFKFLSLTSNSLNYPMKFPTLTLGLAGLAALASFSAASASELCTPVQSAVTKAIVAAPESVLEVVAQQVAASPKCACEIVKAAISAVKSDNATVVAIVEAAAAAAPAELPVVLACAAAAAPQAASALADKFSAETEGSGKNVVGKEPVGKAPVTAVVEEEDYSEDFGFVRPGVGGIYLTIPNSAGANTYGYSKEEIDRLLETGDYKLVDGQLVQIIDTTVTKPVKPIRPPQPPTASAPAA